MCENVIFVTKKHTNKQESQKKKQCKIKKDFTHKTVIIVFIISFNPAVGVGVGVAVGVGVGVGVIINFKSVCIIIVVAVLI